MSSIIRFIKNWTLPIAMIVGAMGYILFAETGFMAPLKPFANSAVEILMPALIFMQLLFSFSKTNPKELLPKRWHVWLALFQIIACLTIALSLIFFKFDGDFKIILEGAMICFICPTATAAVVITGKLGGNTGALTTYTLLSNIVAAVVIPLLFPIINPLRSITFISEFSSIVSKVFPLLMTPFILAMIFRYYIKPIHSLLIKYSGIAFYLWAIALAIVTAQTIHHIATSNSSVYIKFGVATAGLFACALQFWLGRYIGKRYDNTISAGQALGQKNTIVAIWLASTYLTPLSSLAPGSYVLWQNIFNSWQLYRKRSC